MKPEIVRVPLMYEEKEFKKMGIRINKYSMAGWLILLLVLARFLNLGLNWFSIQGELTHKVAMPGVNYTFLHFGDASGAGESLTKAVQSGGSPAQVWVAAYFDLMNPGKFLVRNNNTAGLAPVDLGPVIALVPPGTSQLTINLWDGIRIRNGRDRSLREGYTGYRSSVIGDMLFPGDGKVSFTLKTPQDSFYVMLPYLLYFFLPLLVIFVLGFQTSRAVWAAFLFYPIAFLLMDYKLLFFQAPFYGVIKLLQSDFFNSLEPVLAPVVALLLTLLGIAGLFKAKELMNNFKQTLVILFFLFLPLILRL